MGDFSLDDQILQDRKSTFLVRVKGKKKRLGLEPGDILVVDKNLPLLKDKLALLYMNGRFRVDQVSEEILRTHDPENGNFIWGMIRSVVRELK